MLAYREGSSGLWSVMNVRLLSLVPLMLTVAACANDIATPSGTLPPLVGASGVIPTTTTVATTTSVASAPTTAVVAPTVVPPTAAPPATPLPPTVPPPPPTAADPHGVAIETGCVRSNIDFAAVREAPGVDNTQVGEIPPGTCDVLVYAISSDGRIPWLQVAFGDAFGWSAESNFVQSSLVAAP
jgi:hypothetical protein